MSDEHGYLFWNNPFLADPPYLDGHTLDAASWPGSLSWSRAPGLVSVETLARTHVLQRPYLAAGPYTRRAYSFTIAYQAVGWDDFRVLERAEAKGGVYFWPGLYAAETFAATAGSTYYIARPTPWGTVPGVTSVTHPVTFYLDGVEDAASATLTGQSVGALKTGVLEVCYPAMFRVIVSGVDYSVDQPNNLTIGCSMEEVIQLS